MSPFVSRSQMRWMARREPAMFRRWRKEYPGQRYKDLPEKAAPEVYDADFKFDKYRDLMTSVPKGPVGFDKLRIGDMIEELGDESEPYRFGVVVRLDPVGEGKQQGSDCLVWSYWEAFVEVAMSSFKKKKITWSSIGESLTYIHGCNRSYRILRRGILDKASPEVHDAPVDIDKYADLVKRKPLPKDPVDYTGLRVGDLYEDKSVFPQMYGVVAHIGRIPGSTSGDYYVWSGMYGKTPKEAADNFVKLEGFKPGVDIFHTNGTRATFKVLRRGLRPKSPKWAAFRRLVGQVKDAPEVHDAELGRYVELLGRPLVSVDKLRVGDLAERVPVTDNVWRFFIVTAIDKPYVAGDSGIYALFEDSLERLRKEWAAIDPKKRTSKDITKEITGAILKIKPGVRYRILEHNMQYKQLEAPVEFEKFTELLMRPKGPVSLDKVRKGDLVHVVDKMYPGTINYGVIVYIGHEGHTSGNVGEGALWAIWKTSPKDAVASYLNATFEQLARYSRESMNTVLHRQLPYKENNEYYILKRGVDKRREMDAPVEFEKFGKLLKPRSLPKDPVTWDEVKVGDLVEIVWIRHATGSTVPEHWKYGVVTHIGRAALKRDIDADDMVWARWKSTKKEAIDVWSEQSAKIRGPWVDGGMSSYVSGRHGDVRFRVLSRGKYLEEHEAPIELEKYHKLLKRPRVPYEIKFKDIRVGDILACYPIESLAQKWETEVEYVVVGHLGVLPEKVPARSWGRGNPDSIWGSWGKDAEAVLRKALSSDFDDWIDGRAKDFYKIMLLARPSEKKEAPVELEKFGKLLKPQPLVPKPVKWNDLRIGDIFRGCYNCHKKMENWWYGYVVKMEMPKSPDKHNRLYIHFGKTEAEAIGNPHTPTLFVTDIDFEDLVLVRHEVKEIKKAPGVHDVEVFEAARKYSEAKDLVTVYHGTTVKNLKRIIDTGRLDPRAKLEHPVWTSGVTAKEPRTYVTLKASDAWFWSGGAAQDEPGAVIKFKVAKDRIYERRLPGGEGLPDYFIRHTVPAKDIQGQTAEGDLWRPVDAVTFEAAEFEDYVKLLKRQPVDSKKPVAWGKVKVGDLVQVGQRYGVVTKIGPHSRVWAHWTSNGPVQAKDMYFNPKGASASTWAGSYHQGVYVQYSILERPAKMGAPEVYDAEFEKYVQLLTHQSKPVTLKELESDDLVRALKTMYYQNEWKEGTKNEARAHKEWFDKGAVLQVTNAYARDFCARVREGEGYKGDEMCYLSPKYFELYSVYHPMEAPDGAEFLKKFTELMTKRLSFKDLRAGDLVEITTNYEGKPPRTDNVLTNFGVLAHIGPLDLRDAAEVQSGEALEDYRSVGDKYTLWADWKSTPEAAVEAATEGFKNVPEFKSNLSIVQGKSKKYGKVTRLIIHRRGLPVPAVSGVVKKAPEVYDAAFEDYVKLLKRPAVPLGWVDETQVRPGDIVRARYTRPSEPNEWVENEWGVVVHVGPKGDGEHGSQDPHYVWAYWSSKGAGVAYETYAKWVFEKKYDASTRYGAEAYPKVEYMILDRDPKRAPPPGYIEKPGSIPYTVKKAPVEFEKFHEILKKHDRMPIKWDDIRVGDLLSGIYSGNVWYGVIAYIEKGTIAAVRWTSTPYGALGEFHEKREGERGMSQVESGWRDMKLLKRGVTKDNVQDLMRRYKDYPVKMDEIKKAPEANGTLKEQYTPPQKYKAAAQGPRHELNAPAQDTKEDLKSYLETIVKFRSTMNIPKGWKYNSMEEFVLKNGSWHEPAPLPKGIKRGKMKECFMNATNLIFKDYQYVEGFALRPGLIAVNHAWNLDKEGHVIDATWGYEPETAYLGVVFSDDYVFDTIQKKKTYGVIDNIEGRWPLLSGKDVKW